MVEKGSDGGFFRILVVVGDEADETTSDVSDAWGLLVSIGKWWVNSVCEFRGCLVFWKDIITINSSISIS